MKKWLTSCLICGALVSTSAVSSAQPFGEGGKGMQRGGMMKELNLSPEQIKQLKSMRTPEHRQELWDGVSAEREKLNGLMRDRSASEDDIRRQFEILNRKQNELGSFRLEKMLQLRKILNDEQLKKMSEMRDEHRGMRGGRGGEGVDNDGHGRP